MQCPGIKRMSYFYDLQLQAIDEILAHLSYESLVMLKRLGLIDIESDLSNNSFWDYYLYLNQSRYQHWLDENSKSWLIYNALGTRDPILLRFLISKGFDFNDFSAHEISIANPEQMKIILDAGYNLRPLGPLDISQFLQRVTSIPHLDLLISNGLNINKLRRRINRLIAGLKHHVEKKITIPTVPLVAGRKPTTLTVMNPSMYGGKKGDELWIILLYVSSGKDRKLLAKILELLSINFADLPSNLVTRLFINLDMEQLHLLIDRGLDLQHLDFSVRRLLLLVAPSIIRDPGAWTDKYPYLLDHIRFDQLKSDEIASLTTPWLEGKMSDDTFQQFIDRGLDLSRLSLTGVTTILRFLGGNVNPPDMSLAYAQYPLTRGPYDINKLIYLLERGLPHREVSRAIAFRSLSGDEKEELRKYGVALGSLASFPMVPSIISYGPTRLDWDW